MPLIATGVLLLLYFLFPIRTTILILGIDAREPRSAMGRTDTNILLTIVPLRPTVAMVSIPRDLWVRLPGGEENRINTAHFFAESAQAGQGPYAAMEAVELNFGVDIDHFVRIQFNGLQAVVDALGGIDIELSRPLGGYPAGTHHLNGEQALAFVRDRQGTDDFSRMAQGQLFLRAGLRKLLDPAIWPALPDAGSALSGFLDSDIPAWQLPRLGLAILRAGPEGIDSRVIDRDMVIPFTTAGGAQVLAPRWEIIAPMIQELFGG